jgi:hypothetical protein
MGKRYLADILETMGSHVDGLKFAGGSFSLFEEKPLRELIDLAHEHDVYVSTVCLTPLSCGFLSSWEIDLYEFVYSYELGRLGRTLVDSRRR